MRTEIHSINLALAKSPFLLLFHAFSIDFPCSSQRDNKTRLVLFIKVSHSLSHQALCSPARDVNLKGKCCHLKQNKTKKSNSESPALSIFQLAKLGHATQAETKRPPSRSKAASPQRCPPFRWGPGVITSPGKLISVLHGWWWPSACWDVEVLLAGCCSKPALSTWL